MRRTLFSLALLAMLTGCGASSPTATPLPPSPMATPSIAPTEAAALPTATPTSEPTPTPTLVPTLPPLAPTPTPEITISGEALGLMETIEDEVEGLRGLEELAPITRTLMTQQELSDHMEREFAEEYPPEEVEADTRVLAAFDFVPQNFDLLGLLLDLYSSQVLGLYDDEEDTFYVLSEGEFDLLDQITFAHEYTHGLQDEHFDLEAFIDDEVQNDDEVLARLALVEGDATLAMTEWLMAQLSRLSQQDLAVLFEADEEADQAALEAAPPIIRETFEFPYIYGLEFVTLLYDEGWDAVDAAFADPPQSTEQILHPDKYFSRDEPLVLAVPPLTDTLGAGWQLVEADTLGEFQTALYLELQVDEETAAQAAEGWDGDQYAVYVNGDDEVLVFVTAWDSAADREEFVAAYGQYAEGKYGEPATRSGDVERWWQTPPQTTSLAWDGATVWIVVGPDAATVEKVLETLQ